MTVRITYFVHGTTTDNEKDLATGWAHGKLSDLGRIQAQELGRMMENTTFDAVFCSDLKRAVKSAEIGFGNKYKIIPDKRLRECNYGSFTGNSATLFKDHLDRYINNHFPNGENLKDVEKRVASFIQMLKKDYDGKHVAIISHQAPQMAFDVLLKGRTWKQAIDEDWRNKKAWKPGWTYEIK